jgi:hypothetical protein
VLLYDIHSVLQFIAFRQDKDTEYILRCGEMTKNEFDRSIFVGKLVYIYTKVSPFIKNLRERKYLSPHLNIYGIFDFSIFYI